MWQPKFTFKIYNKAKSLTRERKRETRKKNKKEKREKKREKEKKRNVDSIKLCHVETTCAPYSD